MNVPERGHLCACCKQVCRGGTNHFQRFGYVMCRHRPQWIFACVGFCEKSLLSEPSPWAQPLNLEQINLLLAEQCHHQLNSVGKFPNTVQYLRITIIILEFFLRLPFLLYVCLVMSIVSSNRCDGPQDKPLILNAGQEKEDGFDFLN